MTRREISEALKNLHKNLRRLRENLEKHPGAASYEVVFGAAVIQREADELRVECARAYQEFKL